MEKNKTLSSEIISELLENLKSVRNSLVEIQGEAVSIAYKIQKEINKLDSLTKEVF